MFVEENDKIYVVENNEVVAAMQKGAYYGDCPHPECEHYGVMKYDLGAGDNCEGCGTSMRIVFPKEKKEEKESSLDFGDRVKNTRGESGSVMSIVPSIYGKVIGVKFDDGGINEYTEDQLERIETPAPVFASDVEALVAEYTEYETMPAHSIPEIEKKKKIARGLNLRAKALTTDTSLPLSERVELDSIVTATAVDSLDLEESQRLLVEAETNYLDSAPKYELGKEFMGWGSLARTKTAEDISWVSELGSTDVETDWKDKIVGLANEATENLTLEDIESDAFTTTVASFASERIPEEFVEEFKKAFATSLELRKSELLSQPVVDKLFEEETEDIPFEGIFL